MKHTGLSLERIESSIERDNFMNPTEAQSFGIIDQVLTSPPKGSRGSNATGSFEKPKPIIVNATSEVPGTEKK